MSSIQTLEQLSWATKLQGFDYEILFAWARSIKLQMHYSDANQNIWAIVHWVASFFPIPTMFLELRDYYQVHYQG